jgi:RNA polymerase sigma factor (sigma-70 family)
MTAELGWAGAGSSDAELASAAAAGDRAAFARIYDRYADRLHDFCVGMLRDREAAADCVQDTFCAAATRLSQLRDPDKLRPWLYAIARNEGLRAISKRSREQPYDEVPEESSSEDGPDTAAARMELADLVADAAGGLSERDRSVLELSYRHGLDAVELGQALGVSTAAANKLVQRMRHTVQHSLGALLVSRAVRDNRNGCPELAAILDGGDGQFSVLMRKRIVRHIESCPVCDEQRRRLVNPVALLGGTPVFLSAPSWLRDQVLADLPAAPATASERPSAAQGGGLRRRRPMLLVSVFAAVLAIPTVLSIAWLEHHSTPVAPAVRSETVSSPPAKGANGSRLETTGTAPNRGVVTKLAPAEPTAPSTSFGLNSSSPVIVPQPPPQPEPPPIVAPVRPPAQPASPPTSGVITKPPVVKPPRPPGKPPAPPPGVIEPTSPPVATPQNPPMRIPIGPVPVTTQATSIPIIG